MASRAAPAFLRVGLGAAAAVVLLVAAATTDHAVPTGINRPTPAVDPIAGRCWPLPTAHPDFGYQVRTDDKRVRDDDGERRRVLLLQYDLVDADRVSADVAALLTAAGFAQSPSTAAGDPVDVVEFVEPGYGTVRVRVTALPGVDVDTIVRGVLELDLPAAAARDQVESQGCTDEGRG